MGKRKTISAETMAEVVLEAICGLTTVEEIAAKYQVSPNMVTKWTKQTMDILSSPVADGRSKNKKDDLEKKIEYLNREMAQLQSALSWLKEHSFDD